MSETNKAKLRKFLVFLSIFLGCSWVFILSYGVLVESEVNTNASLSSGEMYSVDIRHAREAITEEENTKNLLDQSLKELIPDHATPSEVSDKKEIIMDYTVIPQALSKDSNMVFLKKENVNKAFDVSLPGNMIAPNIINESKELDHNSVLKKNSDLKASEANPKIVAESFAKIAILISNLGRNEALTASALNLPKEFSLGFLNFTLSLNTIFEKSIKDGRDIFLYIPFQPQDYPHSTSGPNSLLEKNQVNTNVANLKQILTLFPGISGGYGNTRETFSANEDVMNPIIASFEESQLKLVISRTLSKSDNFLLTHPSVISCDLVIDSEPTEKEIKANLTNLVNLAKKNGSAVGFTDTYPITLKILSEWVRELEDIGVKIVPITKIK